MKTMHLSFIIGLILTSNSVFAGDLISGNQPGKSDSALPANDEVVEQVMSAQRINDLRVNSIREAVYTVSLQLAVNQEYNKIERQLEKSEVTLARMFDLSPFLLANNRMLPPIITESEDNLRLLTDEEAVASLVTFKIKSDARIVSRDLSWRDYLLIADYPVQKLNPILKPKNKEESIAWSEAKAEGKRDGAEQAYLLYLDNLARLTRDASGAIRFHRLLKQGIITKPTLASGKSETSISGKTLSIGHTIYRLTEHSVYQEASKWKVKSSQMRP